VSASLGSPIVNISDFRPLAKRRLPKSVFDYLDGGADGEITLRENCRAFDDIVFRPRCAVASPDCGLKTTVLGQELSFPAMLAPVGYSRLMHPGGEAAAAAAAGKHGIAYILSTISGHSMEKVKSASAGPVFYQLYLLGGRPAAEAAIDRARNAGFSALVVTIDTPVSGLRERDIRNGIKELLGVNPLAMVPYLPDVLAHPRWLIQFLLDGGVPKLANVAIPGKGPMPMVDVGAALAASAVKWEDLRWIREHWRGPIAVKGLLTGEDARRAVDEGAAAVSVSNHGGRQLDGVRPSIRALPEVVAAIKGQAEVWMDGGVRRGSDIVKALCLGARAVLCGRAYAYALSAAGEEGVRRALEILRADVERTVRLLGCPSVQALDESYVEVPATWKR
jgi:isopentenyl diphosphate isomerase/L-lactate dehydrogenase-like FMN-dependent dehydrogenase